MRVIMIGDVVGVPGLETLERRLPLLIAKHKADFAIVNGENAAAGFGTTEETLDRILAAGADVVTGGNHTFEKREFWPVLDGDKPTIRPANYPCITTIPGKGWIHLKKNGHAIVVINLQGRELMTPIDCPFRCFDYILEQLAHNTAPSFTPPFIIVDFHAESTEEKEALAYYLDGRASIVAGTHTHIPTADERILPKGTAYITDLGMTGISNGILGMNTEVCLKRAFSHVTYRIECAEPALEKDCCMQGIVAELDDKGKALSIERI